MKMEVLSVQNQFQGQFGMIGSTKVKDWTSPLTSPLPAHHRHNHHHRNHYHHHQNNRHHHSNTHYSSSGGGNNAVAKSTSLGGGGGGGAATVVVPPTATEAVNGDGVVGANNNQGIDLVDGYTPRIDGHYHGPHATTTEQQQQQHHQHNNHHRHNQQYYHHYHQDYHQNQHSYHHHNQTIPAALATSAAAAATATSAFALRSWKNNDSAAAAVAAAAIDDDTVAVDASNIVDQQQSLLHSSSSSSSYTPPSTPPPSPHHYNISRYSSNLICYGGGANITGGGGVVGIGGVDVIDAAAINELSIRLQSELRAAKSRHLACTEVSLPWDLTPRIAAEIIRLSEKEPCGIRGCTIYIEFEDEPSNTRRIASLKIDPNTVSTFELYLTLKHDKSGWTSLLPQFIKNLTRSSTILISPDFSLTKNKLYHNSSE